MISSGTVTGRYRGNVRNIIELPKGCNYMVTTNKSQLMAAIKAVAYDQLTIIDAVNKFGDRIARYSFDRVSGAHRVTYYTVAVFEKHLRKVAGRIRKTPAACWR